MVLPTLYKKGSTGAIQFWTIVVAQACECEFDNNDKEIPKYYDIAGHSDADNIGYAGRIKTFYGQVGTESPQTTVDTIFEGKNTGKSNQTTPYEQAQAEAKARWEKKKKYGYVNSLEAAEKGELDALIEGGIVPMLAHTFEKQGKKIKYPCYVQPKLDGLRCIAILENGICTLWSRTRKPITSCPHIIAEIEKNFKEDIVLDGELYNHDLKKDFEKIVSAVRKETPEEGYLNVQYHIYDLVNNSSFDNRTLWLAKKFASMKTPNFKYLKLVETHMVEDETQVPDWFLEFSELGYEGAMLRNAASPYVNKRSSDLIKVKEMQDDEFEIVSIEEGRGKLQGHVGAFVCVNDDGQEFKAKLKGDTEKLKTYFENHSLWKGKKLTVQFQDLTSYGIPRFPVGLRIRESE